MRQRPALALLVAGSNFMLNLDGTIVTTALPTISADLHTTTGESGLVVTSYLVALASCIPLAGWLQARVPARWLFTGAILVFTLASLGCSTATTLPVLAGWRIVQGVGGAMLLPMGRQLVLRDAPLAQIQTLIAYIVWPALVAPVVAPLVGGLIVEHWRWQWIFLLNLPLGLVAMGFSLVLVPRTTDQGARRLDVPGFVGSAAGLGGLVWTAHLLSGPAPVAPSALWGAASVALCAATVWHLRRSDHPLMDLGVFDDSVFAGSQGGLLGFAMLVSAIPFLLPLLLQTSFGWSPVVSGTLVMFVFAGNICAKPSTSFLLNRFGYHGVLVWSFAGLTATSVLMMAVPPSAPTAAIAAVAFVSGAFRSIGFTGLATIAFATLPPDRRGAANVVATLTQQVAMALGVAVATMCLAVGEALTGSDTAQTAFVVAAAASAVPAVLGWWSVRMMPPHAGDELRTGAV